MSFDWTEARELIERRGVAPETRSFHRALFGYSPHEGFPRLHVDRYGSWWLALFHAPPFEHEALASLADLLMISGTGVVYKFRNDASGTRPGVVVRGDAVAAKNVVVERGAYRFAADLTHEIDAGAYPDAELLRQELVATSRGKRVVNLFAYTCLFGVAARAGGARGVVNVDRCRNHLDRGRRNYELNGFRVDDRDFVTDDVQRFARRARRGSFDVIVVDPPPVTRSGNVREASDRQIETTLAAILPLVAQGTSMVHFLQCTAQLAGGELVERVQAELSRAGRAAKVELIEPKIEVGPRELAPTYKEARLTLG